MLLDSNIIIYAAQPKYVNLRKWLESKFKSFETHTVFNRKSRYGIFRQFDRIAFLNICPA